MTSISNQKKKFPDGTDLLDGWIFRVTCTKTETYKNPFMYRVCQYNMTHFEVLDNQLCIGAEMWGNSSDEFELKFSELSGAELQSF